MIVTWRARLRTILPFSHKAPLSTICPLRGYIAVLGVAGSDRTSAPEDRRQVYKMMSLRVLALPDDTLIADWDCNDASTLHGSFTNTTNFFRFRALLTGDTQDVHFERVAVDRMLQD